jgi:hypothetical protein
LCACWTRSTSSAEIRASGNRVASARVSSARRSQFDDPRAVEGHLSGEYVEVARQRAGVGMGDLHRKGGNGGAGAGGALDADCAGLRRFGQPSRAARRPAPCACLSAGPARD